MDKQPIFKSDLSVYDSQELTVGEPNYIINTNDSQVNDTDYIRVDKQDAMLNPLLGLFPKGYVPDEGHSVLDVACGPGGWIRHASVAFPHTRFIGIDNNRPAIKRAREHTTTNNNKRVSFEIADIMQPFNCPPDTFDFVNLRFLFGVMPKNKWVDLLQECYRVLKPGGCIRMVECEYLLIPSPADSKITQASEIALEMLWRYGKSFSRYAIAITPMLPAFLQAAHFTRIQEQPYSLDWSYGKDLHRLVLEDYVVGLQELREALMQLKGLTAGEFDSIPRGVKAEADQPGFQGRWPMTDVWAYKK
jgi:ubiquinone/menaquinone biosynthesis C-methylase UbiE